MPERTQTPGDVEQQTNQDSCLFCESQDDLEEHHVVPRRFGGTDGDQNLIVVCSPCHKKIERTWNARFYDRIGARAGMSPNMMYDALKEVRTSLLSIEGLIGGLLMIHEKNAEHANESTIHEYGGKVTKRQVDLIKADAYRELLDGDWMGQDPFADLDQIREFSYAAVEEFESGDAE